MDREFFTGFIKIHILYHASREEICGVEIMRELERHGYKVSPGTLYPTLHRLEGLGYLKRKERVSAGRRRKYYRTTAKGMRALKTSRDRIKELVDEVMEDKCFS